MKCHNCDTVIDRFDAVGANVFHALTGSHIITRWYCMSCALMIGLIKQ